MGEKIFCDLCGATVPIRSNLTQILFGKDVVVEACLNCASTTKSALKTQAAQTIQDMAAAAVPTSVPAEEPAPVPPLQPTSEIESPEGVPQTEEGEPNDA